VGNWNAMEWKNYFKTKQTPPSGN
jgi:hypothetical protein